MHVTMPVLTDTCRLYVRQSWELRHLDPTAPLREQVYGEWKLCNGFTYGAPFIEIAPLSAFC
jgi:hypothetical protein